MEPKIEDITSGFAASIVDSNASLPPSFDVQWTPIQIHGSWRARGGAASCGLNATRALFFGGGARDGGVFNDLLLVDAEQNTGSAQQRPALFCAAKSRFRPGDNCKWAVASGKKREALLHGGADPASARLFDDVWIFDVARASWTQLSAAGLVARHALQAVALPSGDVLVVGGSCEKGPTWRPQTLRVAGSACSVADVTAASLLDLPPRELFAAAVVPAAGDGGQVYVVLHGGHCTDALLQTVTVLHAHSLEVVFTEDAPEARVAHAGVCVAGGSLMMYGGTNMLHPPAYDDCLMFDLAAKRWARGTCTPLPNRFAHGMAACGGKVVVAGGINFENDLNDVWVANTPDTSMVYEASAAAISAASQNGIECNGIDDQ